MPGQVAVVTGAGSGIGAAIAAKLCQDGFAVAVADIDGEAARRMAAALDSGGDAAGFAADVSDPEAVDRLSADAVERFGRIDAWVSNAGVGGTYRFLDCPLEHWRTVMAVNLTGTFLCGQAAARQMLRQSAGGRIVNIASVSGIRAGVGRTAYGTSKAGVLGLTRQMAIELAEHGITVNAVAPGPVDTPLTGRMHTPGSRAAYAAMIPMHRYGTAQEIAAAVGFLVSPAASYITGTCLPADGGMIAAGLLADDVG